MFTQDSFSAQWFSMALLGMFRKLIRTRSINTCMCSGQIRVLHIYITIHIPFISVINVFSVNQSWSNGAIWRHRSGSHLGARNRLLHDGANPLVDSMLSYQLLCSVAFIHLRAISQEAFMNLIRNIFSEITLLKLQHLPGANDVTHCGLVTPYGDINLGQHWLM